MTVTEEDYEVNAPQSANNRRNLMVKKSIFDETAMTDAFKAKNLNTSHIQTIWRLMIQQDLSLEGIDTIETVPKEAKKLIREQFDITSKVIDEQLSKDKSTTKLLIELHDGRKIETVIMRYGAVPLASFPTELLKQKNAATEQEAEAQFEFKSGRRATVCVSSQVGCNMGCTFCATGTMGLISSLCSGEILEQLYHANRVEKIRNVVFMGMGEPLANYDEVLKAIKGMTDVRRFNLAPSRISVSTVGVVNRLRTLATDAPGVSLALSLHAPNQDLRSQIVPSSKAYALDRIISAVQVFLRNTKRSAKNKGKDRLFVLVEYVLIADINDSDATAHELGALLGAEADQWMLNVIPYNPTDVPHDYKAPTNERRMQFLDIVKSYGVRTVVRQEMGQDVAAACGQLVVKHEKKIKAQLQTPAAPVGIWGKIKACCGGDDMLAATAVTGAACLVGALLVAAFNKHK